MRRSVGSLSSASSIASGAPLAAPSRSGLAVVLLFASLLVLAPGCGSDDLAGAGGACARPGRGSAAGCLPGLVCSYGVCRKGCEQARECADGERCIASERGDGVCSTERESACGGAHGACPGALECAGGECRTGCATAGDCVSGACELGACVEPISTAKPDGASCTSDEGCAVGSACVLGRCRPACEAGCGRGSRCLHTDTGDGCSLADEDTCAETLDCTSGLVCAEGECRTPCADDLSCGAGGRCVSGSCDEPVGTGRRDAGRPTRRDGGPIEVPDAYIPGVDGGPVGAEARLASVFTANPLPSQTLTELAPWTSPRFVLPNFIRRSAAPLHVALSGRSDPDERGVGYVGVADQEGRARVFRFPGDAPSAATEVSTFASLTRVIDLDLAEDGALVRGLFLRERLADDFSSQVAYQWAEGSSPTALQHRVGPLGDVDVVAYGEATILGGERSIGPDQDARFVLRERERFYVELPSPGSWTVGNPYLSVIDVAGGKSAVDRTDSLFTSSPLSIEALHELGLVWDPTTGASRLLRVYDVGTPTLSTAYEPLAFLPTTTIRPTAAPNPLNRTSILVALASGASVSAFEVSCPRGGSCTNARSVSLPALFGGEIRHLAAAPLMNGFALVTDEAGSLMLQVLERDLSVVPGHDDGSMLTPIGSSVFSIDDETYTLVDLRVHAFASLRSGVEARNATLLVAGLYVDTSGSYMRIRVHGVRAAVLD